MPNPHFIDLSNHAPSCPAGAALIPPIGGVCVIFTNPSSNKGVLVASTIGITWVAVQVEHLTHTF